MHTQHSKQNKTDRFKKIPGVPVNRIEVKKNQDGTFDAITNSQKLAVRLDMEGFATVFDCQTKKPIRVMLDNDWKIVKA